jgi:hypothetical protein
MRSTFRTKLLTGYAPGPPPFAIPQFFLHGEDARAKLLTDQPKRYKQIDENIKAYAGTVRSREERGAIEYRTQLANPPAAAVEAPVRLIEVQQKVAADRQRQVGAAA